MFAFVEAITCFIDGVAHIYGKEQYLNRKMTTFVTCVSLFLTSLPYSTRLAPYIMDVVDFLTQTLGKMNDLYECISYVDAPKALTQFEYISLGLLLANFVVMTALLIDFKYTRVMQTMIGTGHGLSKYYGMPTFYFFAPVGAAFLGIYLLVKSLVDSPFHESLTSLVAIGWTLLGIMIVSFIGSLWRCGPSGLPSLTLDDVALGSSEKKDAVPDVDFEDEEPNGDDDNEDAKSVELIEDPIKTEVEQAVDVEA